MIRKNTSAREVRRQKHFVKCITVMDSQVDLLRFIRFRKDIIRKVNGKFKNCGSVYGYGVCEIAPNEGTRGSTAKRQDIQNDNMNNATLYVVNSFEETKSIGFKCKFFCHA